MPIRTDWTLDETVMPGDMNDIGKELNRLKEEDKKLENKKLDKTGGTVTGTINATNLQVGGANVYTTSRKPTSSDVGASPLGHSHDDRYFTEAEMNEKLKTKVSVESGKGLSTNDYTTAEKNKLSGIAAGANAYTHPSSHPATMITEDSTHRFVTDVEKSNWNGKAPKDVATTSVNGLMAAADKVKLNGIANNANNYVHPDNSNTRHVTDSEKNKWNSKADGNHNHFKCGIIDNKDLNDYDGEGLVGLTNNNCTNQPTGGYFYIFNIKYNNSSNNLKQIAYGYNQGQMYTRYRTSGTWSGWTRMYSSTDKPTPADIGALGATAKAESAKTADAVAWANVTGKPSSFTPSSHTHTKSQITDMPTALKNPTAVKVQLNGGTTEGTNQFTYDGSAAKTINVTPANIGALPSGGTAANALKLNGAVESASGTGNTIARRDSNGDLSARLMRSSYANQSSIGGALAFRENNGSDNFIRFCSDAQAILNWLGTNKAKYEMLGTATKFDIAMPNTSANFMRCTFSCGNKQEMSSIYVNVNGKYVTDWTVGGSFSMVVEFMKIGASSYVMSMNVHCAMRNSDMSYRLTTSTNKLDYASIQKITFEHSQAGYKLENCAYTLEWY
ncbi:MAG: pyocin knob domain-containing protein [Clostridium sp.]|uniref:pyocin knob domain-containing protein n=2 Tax=Clostridiaceae TaxID=31979 RepID=UPI002480C8FE|nr:MULTISPECIES: pyocin knob domain-containing protein [Clostridium]MDB2086874.1 pyocin knob domain-containing protein [Clostridium paraputrificum]MDU2756472.1 pyocin knob domain-containing protein [Clostridium sp.]MDU2902033.1 pyocin knob domain-containing protein [Clostridium sp.]MDU3678063.1 pyocin knob domain-containing protein [Clostridium sp.]MDU4428372.1 pyocin knob domain-containing protein [Clostridium sp.]